MLPISLYRLRFCGPNAADLENSDAVMGATQVCKQICPSDVERQLEQRDLALLRESQLLPPFTHSL